MAEQTERGMPIFAGKAGAAAGVGQNPPLKIVHKRGHLVAVAK